MNFTKNEAGRRYVTFSDDDQKEILSILEYFNSDRHPDVIGINIRKITFDYSMIVKMDDGNNEHYLPQDETGISTVNGRILK